MSNIKAVGLPRTVFSGKIVKLVHQDMKKGKKEITYERAERAPGVRLIIRNGDGDICLTKEHRTELNGGEGGYDYRLPGGKVFDTLNEYEEYVDNGGSIMNASIAAAGREAKEETGVKANSVFHIHTSGCGTTMWRDLYYFEVTDVTLGEQELDGMEHIDVQRYNLHDIKKLCLDGSIQEDRSVAVLLRYLHQLS